MGKFIATCKVLVGQLLALKSSLAPKFISTIIVSRACHRQSGDEFFCCQNPLNHVD